MKIYKKFFQYVSDSMISGYLAIILSSLSAVVMVYGYYYSYRFFYEIIVNENFENAFVYSINIVSYLALSFLCIFYRQYSHTNLLFV